jgi:isochorismate hydrolase
VPTDIVAAGGGIPAIRGYPMPGAAALPVSTAAWRVDPDRAVLLVHDMQRYFLAAFPDDSPLPELVTNLGRLRSGCADLGIPVAYTAQPGAMSAVERGLLADFWGPGMSTGPGDREVVAPLSPAEGDWLLTKWRYSAFFRTDLAARMRASRRDQLIIGGVYAHVGIMITATDAFTRDIQTFVVADAVADFSADHHHSALSWLAARCAVVLTAEEVVHQLDRHGASP